MAESTLQLADALLAATTRLMAALHLQAMTENEAASDDGSTGILPETWVTAVEAANEDAAAAWSAANDAMARYVQVRGLTAEQIAALARNAGVSACAPSPSDGE